MTRRDFRGTVEAPRPTAAWVMSIVASATLWITDTIPPWIIAVQIAAYALSFATRSNPPAFRRSPIWLNIGMLGVTTVTVRAALAGHPATVSLAFFTSLAQGLQLLDARPRRSEFLLVALALFQVILASNLTDSIFFPPLVLLFLASVTWTLLIHTLHIEAAEAGDPTAAPRAIRSDLSRMTAFATCGCLVLALALFVLLPRVKTNMMRGALASGLSISGFSDRVRLGEVGKIRKDHSVVLRVEAIEGALPPPGEAYWRGIAFDAFDGQNWSVSAPEQGPARRPISGIGRFGIVLDRSDSDAPMGYRIIREAVEAGVLFTSGTPKRIEGPFQRIERGPNGAIYLAGQADDRIRYTVWSSGGRRDPSVLSDDRATLPVEPARGGLRPADRYLALPELDPRVSALASEIAAGASSDFERAERLQNRLRQIGRYTDDPSPLGDSTESPIEAFLLGDIEGHCEYFASAMVVLARSGGLPARLVTGFAGGVRNRVGEFLEVTQADAHAWVEIHFERAGWVRFDPTPPDLRLRTEDSLSLLTQIAQLGSALELWWFQRVVDFDSADQIGALKGLWLAWKGDGEREPENLEQWTQKRTRPSMAGFRAVLDEYGPWFFVGLVVVAILVLGRSWREPADSVPATYRRTLRFLDKRGWSRRSTVSARDFARDVSAHLPDDAARALERITEGYLSERFGDAERQDLVKDLVILEGTVNRMGLRNQANVR